MDNKEKNTLTDYEKLLKSSEAFTKDLKTCKSFEDRKSVELVRSIDEEGYRYIDVETLYDTILHLEFNLYGKLVKAHSTLL